MTEILDYSTDLNKIAERVSQEMTALQQTSPEGFTPEMVQQLTDDVITKTAMLMLMVADPLHETFFEGIDMMTSEVYACFEPGPQPEGADVLAVLLNMGR